MDGKAVWSAIGLAICFPIGGDFTFVLLGRHVGGQW
jgi:hypothetical protein